MPCHHHQQFSNDVSPDQLLHAESPCIGCRPLSSFSLVLPSLITLFVSFFFRTKPTPPMWHRPAVADKTLAHRWRQFCQSTSSVERGSARVRHLIGVAFGTRECRQDGNRSNGREIAQGSTPFRCKSLLPLNRPVIFPVLNLVSHNLRPYSGVYFELQTRTCTTSRPTTMSCNTCAVPLAYAKACARLARHHGRSTSFVHRSLVLRVSTLEVCFSTRFQCGSTM